jgi:uncharacterized protein YegL
MRDLLKRYKTDEGGNFSIILGFTILLLILITSAALEISRLSSAKGKLQNIADSAALAGAVAADQRAADRLEQVRNIIEQNGDLGLDMDEPEIVFNDDTQIISVSLSGRLPSFLSAFLGKKTLNTSAVSESLYAPESIAPITIVFALDVSGSMNEMTSDGDVKVETLKDSIEILFTSLEAGSKNKVKLNEKLRTGMSAYNTELVEEFELDYGWEELDESIDRLVAGGGTNSVPALQNAYDQLRADRDYRRSKGENVDSLVEFVVFMTDGDNNQPEWDEESFEVCNAMKEDGIDIYSIAFAAPEKGEALLLDCASSNTGEETDDEDSKCLNSGAKGAGKANGHCDGKKKKDIEEAKSRHYFDAEDAKSFKKAFDAIGESVATVYIRIL